MRYLLKLFPAEEHCVDTRRMSRAQHACGHPQAGHEGLLGLGSWNSKARLVGLHKDYLVTEDWIPTLRADIYLRHFHQWENSSLVLEGDGHGMTQKWPAEPRGSNSLRELLVMTPLTDLWEVYQSGWDESKNWWGVVLCGLHTDSTSLQRQLLVLTAPHSLPTLFFFPSVSPCVLEGRSNFPACRS